MNRLAFVAALATVSMCPLAAHADGTVHSSLFEGDYLFQGQRVVADSGYYHLEMQGDGNLVVYAGAGTSDALWSTGTWQYCLASWPSRVCAPRVAQYATLQDDGNFVVYWGQSDPAWASNTAGSPDPSTAQLWMQGDGNLVEYRWASSNRYSVWDSHTAGTVLGQTSAVHTSVTHVESNTNFAGDDYNAAYTNDAMQCGQWCASSAFAPAGTSCNAFTWVPPGVQGPSGVCWLKSAIPGSSFASGMVSGYIRH